MPRQSIVITCGGTGGHIYPAIALAQYIQGQDHTATVHFIGTSSREDAKIIPRYEFPFTSVMVSEKSKLALICAIFKTIHLFKKLNPSYVISTGGLSTVPISIAAILKKTPLYLLEQNAIAGRTNRLFARWATHIFPSFANINYPFPAHKTTVTGNPIRTQFAKDKIGQWISTITFNSPPLLIFGGSQGSRRINQIISDNYTTLITANRPLIHITGHDEFKRLIPKLMSSADWQKHPESDVYLSKTGQQIIIPYCESMDILYHMSGIVISRSGATTTAELAQFQKKAILIPFPLAKDDHQTANANAHKAQFPAELIPEADLSWEAIEQALNRLSNAQWPPQSALHPAEKILKIIQSSSD